MSGENAAFHALTTNSLAEIGGANERTLRVEVPGYDRAVLRPSIVHIGVGGFHRAHLARYVDQLCEQGHTDWAIVGVGTLPGDVAMAEALGAQDNLYTLVTRDVGQTTARVVGSIIEYIHAHPDQGQLVARIASPITQIVSLTITEGGYPVDDTTGSFLPDSPVAGPGSAFAALARGLDERRQAGAGPVTILSCDNVVGNGRMTQAATVGEAAAFGDELISWISENVAFPNSMVDRITPGTTDDDRRWLAEAAGVDDRWPVFAEPFTLWVVEDRFAGERPPFEDLDVVVTDHVEPFEQMKLLLLNAGHSTIAYLAALRGHGAVHDAMADPAIAGYLDAFLVDEARPVLPAVPGYDVDGFQRGLVERFSNPAVGDQIARLCLDGSVKFPKFLLPTVRAQLASGGPIGLSALALAGWCHYLRATAAEDGSAISVAGDPNRDEVVALAEAAASDPASFLGYESVFGADLAGDERFVSAFVDAHQRLSVEGVVPSIQALLAT